MIPFEIQEFFILSKSIFSDLLGPGQTVIYRDQIYQRDRILPLRTKSFTLVQIQIQFPKIFK